MQVDPKIVKEYENNHMQFRIDRMISDDYYKEVSNIIFDAPDDPKGFMGEKELLSHIFKTPFTIGDTFQIKSNNPDLNEYSTYCILKKFDNEIESCINILSNISAFYIPETMEQITLINGFIIDCNTTTFIDISLEKILSDSNKIPNIDIPSYHKYGSENINIDGHIYKRFAPTKTFQTFDICDDILETTNIYCEMVSPLFTINYIKIIRCMEVSFDITKNKSLYYDKDAVITYMGENNVKKSNIQTV